MNLAKVTILVGAVAASFAGAFASTITVAPSGGDYDNIPAAVAAANTAIAGGETSVTIYIK